MEHLVYLELLLFVYLADNEQYQLSKQSSIKVKNLMFTVYRVDKPSKVPVTLEITKYIWHIMIKENYDPTFKQGSGY